MGYKVRFDVVVFDIDKDQGASFSAIGEVQMEPFAGIDQDGEPLSTMILEVPEFLDGEIEFKVSTEPAIIEVIGKYIVAPLSNRNEKLLDREANEVDAGTVAEWCKAAFVNKGFTIV